MSLAGSCGSPVVGAAPAMLVEGEGPEVEPVLEWSVHQRVFPDLKHILPHCPDLAALRIVQTWQPTRHDMISWKSMVEHERDEKTGRFVAWAQQVCEEVRRAGYWADFVDPSTGLAVRSLELSRWCFSIQKNSITGKTTWCLWRRRWGFSGWAFQCWTRAAARC
jgi:hypothetical protein